MLRVSLPELANQGENTMTKLTVSDLAPFYRNAIGVDRILGRILDSVDQQNAAAGYPPYNIIRHGENRYEIQIAVAGFTEGEITVKVENGNLIVTGEKEPSDTEINFIHQGISARRFVRSFSLAEYVEVVDAAVTNGILSVNLEHIVPDSLKPRTINITYNR